MYKLTKDFIKTIPPKEYFIKSLCLETGTVNSLNGIGGSGKSTFSIYMMFCVLSGLPLFGEFEVCKADKALYIDQEMNLNQFNTRIARIANGCEFEGDINLTRRTLPRIDIKNETSWSVLDTTFDGYKFVIIDSMKAFTNADENSGEIEPLIKYLKRLAERQNSCILFISHKGKNTSDHAVQTIRGSSMIYDSLDNQIDIDYTYTDYISTLKSKKTRDDEGDSEITFITDHKSGNFIKTRNCTDKLIYKLSEKKRPLEERIISFLMTKVANQTEIHQNVGGDKTTLIKVLNELITTGFIEMKRHGNSNIYTVKESGFDLINKKKEIVNE